MRRILVPAATAALVLLVSCKTSGFKDDPQAASTVGRTYATDVGRAWQALETTVKEFDLDVDKSDHDALGGQMTIRRATGDTVYARVRSVNSNSTIVDIAPASGDRNMAQMIQDKVAEKLGADQPGAPGMAAGSAAQGTYDNPLQECAAAAERALKVFNLPVEARENHDVWIAIRSKHLDTIPVNIKLMRTPKDQTDATFTVGTSPSDDNGLLANRLKKEFETALSGQRQP
jgi:hypothetical protein